MLFGIFALCLGTIVILTPFEIAAGEFHLVENGMLSADGVSCFTVAYLASVLITWLLRQRKNQREASE